MFLRGSSGSSFENAVLYCSKGSVTDMASIQRDDGKTFSVRLSDGRGPVITPADGYTGSFNAFVYLPEGFAAKE